MPAFEHRLQGEHHFSLSPRSNNPRDSEVLSARSTLPENVELRSPQSTRSLRRYALTQPPPAAANAFRGQEQMSGGKRSYNSMVAHSRQSHGRNAAALLAVRIATKLAGRDPRLQIGRDCRSSPREDALRRAGWRKRHLRNEFLRHFKLGILDPQLTQLRNHLCPLRSRQNLGILRAPLRSKQAEPNLEHLRLPCPEREKLIQVA